jgi:nucleoside-diphosphate-sugar epimerase
MTIRVVSVLGGTGFLGRRIVRRLGKLFSVCVASRHPESCQELFGTDDPHIHSVRANVRDEQSIADAIAGALAVVNTVSLYLERGNETFHSVHVEAARRVAAQAQRAGIEQLVHVSGSRADGLEQGRTGYHDRDCAEAIAQGACKRRQSDRTVGFSRRAPSSRRLGQYRSRGLGRGRLNLVGDCTVELSAIPLAPDMLSY